ncbi:MAG: sulfurtransferase TusA family protein [Colwellia sp.]|nr:sulfurtransferase TusA family protein [Colwellia sp.]MCW9081385.1 sulfurtransferase TusA family protein [Colwellia sp.]
MNFQYDASQEKCPIPLVNLRLLLKKMQNDDTCVIKIKDSGSKEDIPKLLVKLGYKHTLTTIDESVVEIMITNKEE